MAKTPSSVAAAIAALGGDRRALEAVKLHLDTEQMILNLRMVTGMTDTDAHLTYERVRDLAEASARGSTFAVWEAFCQDIIGSGVTIDEGILRVTTRLGASR